jgi:hypothetical protein
MAATVLLGQTAAMQASVSSLLLAASPRLLVQLAGLHLQLAAAAMVRCRLFWRGLAP